MQIIKLQRYFEYEANSYRDRVAHEKEMAKEFSILSGSALKLQKLFIMKSWSGGLHLNRLNNIRAKQKALVVSDMYDLFGPERFVLKKREAAAELIIGFIRDSKSSPFILAKSYLKTIKRVQKYARAFKRITEDRLKLLSLVLNSFFQQFMVHFQVISSGRKGFDRYNGPEEDSELAQQIESDLGKIPNNINMRLTALMLSPEFHLYLRRNRKRISILLKKELSVRGNVQNNIHM